MSSLRREASGRMTAHELRRYMCRIKSLTYTFRREQYQTFRVLRISLEHDRFAVRLVDSRESWLPIYESPLSGFKFARESFQRYLCRLICQNDDSLTEPTVAHLPTRCRLPTGPKHIVFSFPRWRDTARPSSPSHSYCRRCMIVNGHETYVNVSS